MLRLLSATLLVLFCVVSAASAATLVDVKTRANASTQIMTDGKKARMDMGKDGSYMVIDYDRQAIYAVMPEQHQIMDLSGEVTGLGGSAQKVHTELVPAGNGPNVAGYATRKFRLSANGRQCGVIYGSRDAMQAPGMRQLFDAMTRMLDKQQAAMGAYASMVDDCTRASMDFAAMAASAGVPMKMHDARGNNLSEVVAINSNATLPADAFVLPASYKVITIGEKVRQQGMSQLQQRMPQIEGMLKQMQQRGNVPPEAMQQLQQYQQRLQQQ